MKLSTKISVAIGFGLMLASLINLWAPAGLLAAGLWTFAFVYDADFRRKF